MDKKETIMNTTETEEEISITSCADLLKHGGYHRGYIKCRLVHLLGSSIVMPDVLMVSGQKKYFFSPKFFLDNDIRFTEPEGASDFCIIPIELIGKVTVIVAFFRHDLVKRCTDHSFIYKCVFRSSDGKPLPETQGVWQKRGDQFELALYHHTNLEGARGIKSSNKINGSAWNIQGTAKLKNIAYGYFTSVPRVSNAINLLEIGMSSYGSDVYLLPTNAPYALEFAYRLKVYQETPINRNYALKFWIDVEMIAPSHLLKHPPESDFVFYEPILPKVFRVGVKPKQSIPLNGMMFDLMPEMRKSFNYVIVGDADTLRGLLAPYREEETDSLGKVDIIPRGMEIIGRWYEKRNSHLFKGMNVELAELTSTPADH